MRSTLVWLVLTLAAAAAHADGGRLQLRAAAGPFVVSLFSAPESLAVGPCDFSVLVEEEGGKTIALHPDVTMTLTPESSAEAAPISVRFAPARGGDRLLQDAVVRLPHGGRWRVTLTIRDAGRAADATGELTVANASSRWATVWFFAGLPICAIAVFVWTQQLRRRSRRRKTARLA